MKAIMYGGGNIGRGFIGALFSLSGYDVCFVDVAKPVVEGLNARKSYPVRIVYSGGHEDMRIERVSAIDGNDAQAVAEAIAEADIMATAVGVNVLKYIVGNIAAGLRLRFARGDRPLNILICENLMDANKVLEGMIKALLIEEERRIFDARVGLVEASIGRMVPVQTPAMQDGDPLRVCVERYGFLPVDKDAFKGEIPPIRNMVPSSPFDFYIRRKLYLHNMGHACCAYLGLFAGGEYIYESIADKDVYIAVENAMLESALALSAEYGMRTADLMAHVFDLLRRFTNTALGDTCARVGGDPKRKLAPADRLIGAASLCLKQGICPAYIALGAAGAVYHYIREMGLEQSEANCLQTLREFSALEADARLTGLILPLYRLYAQGASLEALRRAAQDISEENAAGTI